MSRKIFISVFSISCINSGPGFAVARCGRSYHPQDPESSEVVGVSWIDTTRDFLNLTKLDVTADYVESAEISELFDNMRLGVIWNPPRTLFANNVPKVDELWYDTPYREFHAKLDSIIYLDSINDELPAVLNVTLSMGGIQSCTIFDLRFDADGGSLRNRIEDAGRTDIAMNIPDTVWAVFNQPGVRDDIDLHDIYYHVFGKNENESDSKLLMRGHWGLEPWLWPEQAPPDR